MIEEVKWSVTSSHLCGVTRRSTVFCDRLGQTRLISLFRSASDKRCARTPGKASTNMSHQICTTVIIAFTLTSGPLFRLQGLLDFVVSVSHQMPVWSPGPCGSGPSGWRWNALCCHLQWACSSSPIAERNGSKRGVAMNQELIISSGTRGCI